MSKDSLPSSLRFFSDAAAGMPDPKVLVDRAADVIFKLVSRAPSSSEQASRQPEVRARAIVDSACRECAALSGGLALVPGPLGFLTVLPDLYKVWRIQSQMVSDIAAVYGKAGSLTPEHMVHCLFRHSLAQGGRDLVVRLGTKAIVNRRSVAALQSLARTLGQRLTQKAIGRAAARWLPVIGAAGTFAYAWFDTRQVGNAAIDLFSSELVLLDAPEASPQPSSQLVQPIAA